MGQDDLAGGRSRAHCGDGLCGVLDREPVGDVDTELSGGHELHRTPQVASDERRIHPAERPEVEADETDTPQPQRRGAHLLILRLGGVPQRQEPSSRAQQVKAAQSGRACHRVGDDVKLGGVGVIEFLGQPGLVIAQV